MDLSEFLLARIAEDEAVARQSHLRDLRDRLARQSDEVARLYGDSQPPEDDIKPADALWWTAKDALGWFDRWDPARVLAECDAKRRIVRQAQQSQSPDLHDWATDDRDFFAAGASAGVLGWTLRVLALPYAKHPDYDPSWRP